MPVRPSLPPLLWHPAGGCTRVASAVGKLEKRRRSHAAPSLGHWAEGHAATLLTEHLTFPRPALPFLCLLSLSLRSLGRDVPVPGRGSGLLLHCLTPSPSHFLRGFVLLPDVSKQLVRGLALQASSWAGLGVGPVRGPGSRHQQWMEPALQGQVSPVSLPPPPPPPPTH